MFELIIKIILYQIGVRHLEIIFQNSVLPDWHGSLRAPPSFPPSCRSNPRWRKPEAPGGPTRTPGARGSPGRDRRRSRFRLEKIIKPRFFIHQL